MTAVMSQAPSYGVADHYLDEKGRKYYASQSGGGDFAARIFVENYQHLIGPEDTVADFGCGAGFLLNRLQCARRIGVEINPIARQHVESLGIECHPVIVDVPDAVADVIISNHALEHVPFPIGALRELRTKLKPGGLLALCVPVDNWMHHRRYDPDNRDHHLHTWTVQLLGNTLFEAGYEVVSIDLWAHAWPGRWTVACFHRLPRFLFHTICFVYAILTGKGRQLFAVARSRGGH
jgi:SAM-dependent methyltransferase